MRIIIFLSFIILSACSQPKQKTASQKIKPKKQNQKETIQVKITADKSKKTVIGDTINFKYNAKNGSADSINLAINYKHYKVYYPDDSLTWNTSDANAGKNKLFFTFYWGDSITASKTFEFELLSNIIPKKYTYKVIKKIPHNINAYTQGLEFSDGFLYEGTGLYKESMLYKIDFDKDEIIQSINLPDEVFGEGITILNNRIYQLTWQSNTGFVYDKETLNKLFEFDYPTEGWGLTNNDKELIMSDGSENIYFLDTEFIQETHRIQVHDNKGTVKMLNELEYIDGLIYANVYGSDYIVAFEEKTGKVVKHIDLSGILKKKDVKSRVDVLNGIAWDKTNKRMVVTGKLWPYFYEIKLISK